MHVYAMKSLEYDDEDQMDFEAPMAAADKPKYPYGLRICLTEKEMAKLNLDPSSAFVGGIVHLHALARITSVSCNEMESGQTCRIELQIEDMAVESEDEENEEQERVMHRPLRALYNAGD